MRKKLAFGDRHFVVDFIRNAPLEVKITEDEQSRDVTIGQTLDRGAGRLLIGDRYAPYYVTDEPRGAWVTLAGETFFFPRSSGAGGDHDDAHGGFVAPMPGKVIQVKAVAGDHVTKGQVLVIMEAMKMEHRIEAPTNGVVTALHCNDGDVVAQGFQLLDFEENTAEA